MDRQAPNNIRFRRSVGLPNLLRLMTNKNIQLLRVTHLRGPNIWTYRPVIEAWVDIGELEDYPSNTLPGFYERLTHLLPGLAVHRCGVGEPGGFLLRLREGTWAAHILEHVVLELQNLAGMRTGFGKTRQTSVRGIYKMADLGQAIDAPDAVPRSTRFHRRWQPKCDCKWRATRFCRALDGHFLQRYPNRSQCHGVGL